MSTNDRTSASAPIFSRRGFLSLLAATGTVVAFGNGSELFVRVAHADEAGVGDPYTLYVVKRWEVPVYLFDVTDPTNLKPVAGATAHITSLYNGKTADTFIETPSKPERRWIATIGAAIGRSSGKSMRAERR